MYHVPSKGALMGGQGPTGRCFVKGHLARDVNLWRETCHMGKLGAKTLFNNIVILYHDKRHTNGVSGKAVSCSRLSLIANHNNGVSQTRP